MKKTIIALTALVAATVGFQGQANAGHKHNSGFNVGVHFGNGSGFSGGKISHKVHKKQGHKKKWHKSHGNVYGYNKHNYYQDRHGYGRRHRCRIAGKRSIRRSLRNRGFYNINKVRRHGRIYSAKATAPSGYRMKLRINGCNFRIVNRKIIPTYSSIRSQNNYGNKYW